MLMCMNEYNFGGMTQKGDYLTSQFEAEGILFVTLLTVFLVSPLYLYMYDVWKLGLSV